MHKVYNQPFGNDIQGQLKMTLTDKQGKVRVRTRKYIKPGAAVEKK